MKKALWIFGIIAIVAGAALLLWRITNRPADTPVDAAPSQDYAVADVAFFLQNDPQWGSDTLGNSGRKMASSGCLVSCIAASLHAQGMDIDPGRLNQLFTDNEVYTDDGDILWNNISKALPNVRVDVPSRINADALENAVSNGLLPIVKVKYKGSGYQHWVLLIGATEDGYLCMDPLNSEKAPLPLSAHGGIIYRYRVVTLVD